MVSIFSRLIVVLFALSVVPAAAQSAVEAQARLDAITETEWKVDDCGPLLVKAGFAKNYAQIADLAYGGNEKAQLIALMYLTCGVDRDLMFGIVTRGGEPGYLSQADASAMASNEWQQKMNRHRPLVSSVCRVPAESITDVDPTPFVCDNVMVFAKKFARSRNPRAFYQSTFAANVHVTDFRKPGPVAQAAQMGVAPAIIAMAEGGSAFIPNYWNLSRAQQDQAVLDLYEKAIALGNGRAAGQAAYMMKTSEDFYEAMNRALSMGYWPGGVLGGAVLQPYPLPSGMYVSNSADNAIRAIEQYRALTRLRASWQEEFGKYTKILAARGSLKENPNAAPGIGIMTAIVMRELRAVNLQANVYQEMRNMLGYATRENWNYEHGEMTVQNDDGFVSSALRMRFDVSSLSCTKAAGAKPAFTCRYSLGIAAHFNFGPFGSFSQVSPTTSRNDTIEWDGKQWTSQTMRTDLLAGLGNYPANASSASAPGTNGLCRSLGAGLIAAGGRSTSKAFDPKTWGC